MLYKAKRNYRVGPQLCGFITIEVVMWSIADINILIIAALNEQEVFSLNDFEKLASEYPI